MLQIVPLAAFVFWLISFPMNGFLMPPADAGSLLYFTLTCSVFYFSSHRFIKEKNFGMLSRLGVALTVLLTVAFPLAHFPHKAMLVLMGAASTMALFRALSVLKGSRDPVLAAGLALALGNTLVFVLSRLPLPEALKFSVIAASLLSIIFIRTEYRTDSNEGDAGKKYLFIYVFYLIGGIFYAYITPLYAKAAFMNGAELFFYTATALAGVYLIRKERDLALALGIILGALSFSLLMAGGQVLTNLSMFAIQAGFGFIDLFVTCMVLAGGASMKATGYAFGTVCLAISGGEALSTHFAGAEAPLIAAGNVILVISVLVFYFTGARHGKAGTEEAPAAAAQAFPRMEELSRDNLEQMLARLYEPFQKRLSEKEKDVLFLVAQGRTYKETAGELGISESTVKTYMKRICEKMGVSGKDELIEKKLFLPAQSWTSGPAA